MAVVEEVSDDDSVSLPTFTSEIERVAAEYSLSTVGSVAPTADNSSLIAPTTICTNATTNSLAASNNEFSYFESAELGRTTMVDFLAPVNARGTVLLLRQLQEGGAESNRLPAVQRSLSIPNTIEVSNLTNYDQDQSDYVVRRQYESTRRFLKLIQTTYRDTKTNHDVRSLYGKFVLAWKLIFVLLSLSLSRRFTSQFLARTTAWLLWNKPKAELRDHDRTDEEDPLIPVNEIQMNTPTLHASMPTTRGVEV